MSVCEAFDCRDVSLAFFLLIFSYKILETYQTRVHVGKLYILGDEDTRAETLNKDV